MSHSSCLYITCLRWATGGIWTHFWYAGDVGSSEAPQPAHRLSASFLGRAVPEQSLMTSFPRCVDAAVAPFPASRWHACSRNCRRAASGTTAEWSARPRTAFCGISEFQRSDRCSLKYIPPAPLVIAFACRYLHGTDLSCKSRDALLFDIMLYDVMSIMNRHLQRSSGVH